MKRLANVGAALMTLSLATAVWAKPPQGHGGGRPDTAGEHTKRAGDKVANEAVDAVTDELVGTSSSSGSTGMPPGLAKQGKVPPGLAKQGKTPPGWEKGRKEGWKSGEPEKKEGWIRRTIRGIFHGNANRGTDHQDKDSGGKDSNNNK